jgi:PKD repeat protein
MAPVGSTIDSIIWDFGDNTALAYGDTVIHGYILPGIYDVTETVINNFGCAGTITQQVTVYALPVASFAPTIPACTGNAVNFIDQSTVQNDTITDYLWDFGDQSAFDTLQNPVHIYNNASTYQVSLIVTSLHGCQATITLPVTVYSSPLFNFTDSLFCFGDTTHFTYVSLNSVPVSGWLWDFGDFITSILPNPTHHYNTAGSYNTCLTVTALNGCSNTVCKTVTINPKPDAGILSDSVTCIGTATTFTDNSTISSGVINQWSWNFGDGTPLVMTQNTNHLYGNDSTYIVTHKVISDQGCMDIISATIEIVPPPVASFIPDPAFGSPPLPVQFLNTSSGAITYQWTFGDGGTDFGISPTHTYTDTGYYSVTLIAVNSYSCSDTAYSHISVLIPYLDLGIQEVRATKLNDLLSLSADLANLGNTSISNFQISAKTETGSPINEQWSSNLFLKPGQLYTYNFVARYEIDPLNVPSFYCIEISDINGTDDNVESNNKKCAAINDEFEMFDIFPNPASGNITVGINIPLDGTIDVSFYNSIGQLMKLDAEIPISKGYNELKYSIRNFAKGFYACSVQFRDNILVKRIIKK